MTVPISRRAALGAGAGLLAAGDARRARAQARPTLRIGVLNDQSGVFREISGPTSVAAVRTAVQEFGTARGFDVEVLVGDHQNKPDVGANLARQWIDRDGVDLIIDVPNSAVALAVSGVVREKNRAYVNSTAGTVELTGGQCSPNTVHWTFDTWMLARSTGGAMVKAGGDSWFFITADYAFGHNLEAQTSAFVRAAGGRVAGAVRHPFPGNTDFSSFMLQAQSSRAKVVGLANAGGDTVNCIKQAAEFGLTRRGGAKLAGLLVFLNDVHALGLQAAQGLVLSETFYWDLDDRTRELTTRIRANGSPNNYPAMSHAGCYAGALHWLKAVADLGPAAARADGAATVARMKAMPTDDAAFGRGSIRADGRKLHPCHLFEVKAPEESRGPWDYYKRLATTPPEEAFRPLAEAGCALAPG